MFLWGILSSIGSRHTEAGRGGATSFYPPMVPSVAVGNWGNEGQLPGTGAGPVWDANEKKGLAFVRIPISEADVPPE